MLLRIITCMLLLVSLSTLAIPLPRTPLPPPLHEEPNLLTVYERKTLTLEFNKLTQEVRTARTVASNDASLAPAKEAVKTATASKDDNAIKVAKRALSDQIETILLSQEGMPKKVQRLREVGRILEYDMPREKDNRRRKGTAFKK